MKILKFKKVRVKRVVDNNVGRVISKKFKSDSRFLLGLGGEFFEIYIFLGNLKQRFSKIIIFPPRKCKK